ncbi:MAG: V-type ATP synthase subunit D [Sulfolobales archaeon]
MSQQLLKISRPTKIELIRLRRRLAIARRLHKILKDRLVILSQELISLVREAINVREELHKKLCECQELMMKSYLTHTVDVVESYIVRRHTTKSLVVGSRIFAGVKLPFYEVETGSAVASNYISAAVSSELSIKCYEETLKLVVKLAEIEESIRLIGNEVARTKRRANALEYFLIPRILNTIKYLQGKFEERERENKARMKRIKELLELRAGGIA